MTVFRPHVLAVCTATLALTLVALPASAADEIASYSYSGTSRCTSNQVTGVFSFTKGVTQHWIGGKLTEYTINNLDQWYYERSQISSPGAKSWKVIGEHGVLVSQNSGNQRMTNSFCSWSGTA